MARPLETLGKMLDLETRDYSCQDRAVAGGLAGYAGTWRRQAAEMFGEDARSWIESVVGQMKAYSASSVVSRQEMAETLREMLRAGPSGTVVSPATESPAVVAAEVPATAAAEAVAEGTRVVEPPAASTNEPTAEPQQVPAEAWTTAQAEAELPVAEPAETPDRSGRGLGAPVTLISGIGEKRGALLANLGITTIENFVTHMPRRYEDYSQLKTIDRLVYGERVSVLATVWEAAGRTTHTHKYLFRAILSDTTGTMEVTWFGPQGRGMVKRLQPGAQVLVSGKVGEYLGRLTMTSPECETVGRSDVTNARIQPVYPLTEGLTQRWLRSTMRRALSAWADRVPDALPDDIRSRYGLLSLSRALWGIHLPDSQDHLAASRRRLAFEQTLYLQLGLVRQKRLRKSQTGRQIAADAARTAALTAALPYELTGAQQRSLAELMGDLAKGEPMSRLLQGDVGSGKTVIAALLMTLVADQGCQAAMMAPTEILAEQHFKGLAALFESFPEPRPTVGLLTGSTSAADRDAIVQGLADGSLRIVVGTHALIQEAVVFKDLALVVIDEQHRFGVDQRRALRDKGHNPHLLVMTATPIPRSLELTVWGHMDVSILDEMPPGRQPIRTRVLHPRERGRAYTFIQSQVAKGRQAFIIYPLVEASDKIDARAAVDEAERLQRDVFPKLRVGLLHGRVRPDEKDAVMGKFSAGEMDVLVATSVVEVGIDIPNATVILIDGADRFGLAQLHQFRGRVGRGSHQSYCLLLAESASATAVERLQALESTNDGFVLAEKDLEMRGPGEFLGTQQSGFPELPMAAFADTRLLHEVRELAEELLEVDPDLTRGAYRALRAEVDSFWQDAGDLS